MSKAAIANRVARKVQKVGDRWPKAYLRYF